MINFTDKAKFQIEELLFDGYSLRIQIIGGGCSGLSYNMAIIPDTEIVKEDNVVDLDNFKCIIDSKSAKFLTGTTIDYSDGLNGQGFTFNNPNAKRNCGCGKSFCGE